MGVSQARLQRSTGSLSIAFKELDGRTRLSDLYQSGCLKARLPRLQSRAAEAVLINTSGGLTDGDDLAIEAHFGARTHSVLSSQAAERIYRSRDGVARVRTSLDVGPHSTTAWLPQETIVFDGGHLSRSLQIALDSTSNFIGVESVVLGRGAMGEVVNVGLLEERWELRIDGELVFVDATRVGRSGVGFERERRALLDGANSFATVVMAGDALLDMLEPVRRLLLDSGVVAGATQPGPLIVARLLSDEPAKLRSTLIGVLEFIASHDSSLHLPKVWTL